MKPINLLCFIILFAYSCKTPIEKPCGTCSKKDTLYYKTGQLVYLCNTEKTKFNYKPMGDRNINYLTTYSESINAPLENDEEYNVYFFMEKFDTLNNAKNFNDDITSRWLENLKDPYTLKSKYCNLTFTHLYKPRIEEGIIHLNFLSKSIYKRNGGYYALTLSGHYTNSSIGGFIKKAENYSILLNSIEIVDLKDKSPTVD